MAVSYIAYRYCSRLMFKCIGLVFAFLLGMHLLVELMHEISALGVGRYNVQTMLAYSCLRLPADLYEFVPVGSMLGMIIALSILARRRELVVMRVSGVSLLQLGCWILFNGAVLISALTWAGEAWIPRCVNLARDLKAQATSNGRIKLTASGVWLRSGQKVARIGLVAQDQLLNVTCYHLNPQGDRLTRVDFSRFGIRVPHGWQLHNNQATIFEADGKVRSEVVRRAMLPIDLSPKLIGGTEIRTNEQNLQQLQDAMKYRKECGLSTRAQELAWWLRIYAPLNAILMILLALPLVLSASDRRSDNSLRMVLGVILGFGFYMFHRMIGIAGIAHQLDVRVVAFIPTALSAVICLGWMMRLK